MEIMLYFVITNPKDETSCIYCTLRNGMPNRMGRLHFMYISRAQKPRFSLKTKLEDWPRAPCELVTNSRVMNTYAYSRRIHCAGSMHMKIGSLKFILILGCVKPRASRPCSNTLLLLMIRTKGRIYMAGVGVKRVRGQGSRATIRC